MKEEIRELERICREKDGTEGEVFLSSEYNFERSIKCFFTYFDEEKPVAFLCLFIPSENEAEVTGFTHPDYRRKGLFTKLYAKAQEELLSYGIERTVFVLEPVSADGAAVLSHLGARLLTGELLMVREYEKRCAEANPEVIFASVGEEPGFSFEVDAGDTGEVIVLRKDGRRIGSARVGIGISENCIYEFEVEEAERNKGYGERMMKEMIKRYPKRLVLQVSQGNRAAVHLYTKCGFETTSVREYYRADF